MNDKVRSEIKDMIKEGVTSFKLYTTYDIKLDDDKMLDFTNNKASQQEFARATALYNMSTGFIKSLNANLTILQLAKRNGQKYEDLMNKLGM